MWSLMSTSGRIGEALFPYLRATRYLCLPRGVVQRGGDVIPSAVSLPKRPPSFEAASCFPACQGATALCQTRMMMWHFCQWRWSQVRSLSRWRRVNDGGSRMSSAESCCAGAAKARPLCLGQISVTQTATQPFCPCQWRPLCPLQGSMWAW